VNTATHPPTHLPCLFWTILKIVISSNQILRFTWSCKATYIIDRYQPMQKGKKYESKVSKGFNIGRHFLDLENFCEDVLWSLVNARKYQHIGRTFDGTKDEKCWDPAVILDCDTSCDIGPLRPNFAWVCASHIRSSQLPICL